MIKTLFLLESSRRCLFHYQEYVFRISVTSIPLFFFLSHSVAIAAWSGIQRLDPQMIPFELFYHLVRTSQFSPQTIFVWFRQLKNIYIGHSSKKDNHPFHSKAFVLLYKFETSWALLGRLSRVFFWPSQGSLSF